MKYSENSYYRFDKEKSKLKIYSDELENFLEKCSIKLDSIELEIESGDIYCYTSVDYNKLNCPRFCDLLKERIPLIQDIIMDDEGFILTFNVDNVELS